MPQLTSNETGKLTMSFEPNTIQHLGVKMYSNIPAALAELVANAYDADAREVKIKLYDDWKEKWIVVEDNWNGMSFEEINECFLKIGRNRRADGKKDSPGWRTASGKKWLWKLALFWIGSKIEVKTSKLGDDTAINFDLDWDAISNWDKTKNGPDYTPKFEYQTSEKELRWTSISILTLKRKTDFNLDYVIYLAESLSRLFNYLDKDFKVWVILNDDSDKTLEVTNELKYESLEKQCTWKFPSFSESLTWDLYWKKDMIRGEIITTVRPLKPWQRWITLFAHGRLVNTPEFFWQSESSNFFSYATGWLDIDFIDDLDEDVISTDRQSLNWEGEEMIELRSFLERVVGRIHFEWREKRKALNKDEATEVTGIDRATWLPTLPRDKADIISAALDAIDDPDGKVNPVVVLTEAIHSIAPKYAELHWRYLNADISGDENVERLYKQGNYFQAASEAVKLYIGKVREISWSTQKSDNSMMGDVFGQETTKAVSLTAKGDYIEKDIEEGQKFYSQWVVTGFKNPVTSHLTETALKSRGLFTEKDCLDILSLLSHLTDRLSKRHSPGP